MSSSNDAFLKLVKNTDRFLLINTTDLLRWFFKKNKKTSINRKIELFIDIKKWLKENNISYVHPFYHKNNSNIIPFSISSIL